MLRLITLKLTHHADISLVSFRQLRGIRGSLDVENVGVPDSCFEYTFGWLNRVVVSKGHFQLKDTMFIWRILRTSHPNTPMIERIFVDALHRRDHIMMSIHQIRHFFDDSFKKTTTHIERCTVCQCQNAKRSKPDRILLYATVASPFLFGFWCEPSTTDHTNLTNN